jgi:hypothetical protein
MSCLGPASLIFPMICILVATSAASAGTCPGTRHLGSGEASYTSPAPHGGRILGSAEETRIEPRPGAGADAVGASKPPGGRILGSADAASPAVRNLGSGEVSPPAAQQRILGSGQAAPSSGVSPGRILGASEATETCD